MIARPSAVALKPVVASVEDVDAALHEMAWLTAKQKTIEADAEAAAERLKAQAKEKLTVEVDGQTMSIMERWQSLQTAVFAWCDRSLKDALPPNKRSLKLSHGEIKLRAIQATVQTMQGKKPEAVALDLARRADLLAKLDELLQIDLEGIPLRNLLVIQFALAKDAIRDEWMKRTDVREFLQSCSIFVEEGKEQMTIVPAAVQVATTV